MNGTREDHDMISAGTIDWDAVHRRIKESQAKLDSGFEPTPEETRALLKTRAAVLARARMKKEKPGEIISIVEFLLADEHYAIETAYLREVRQLKNLTPLPGIPSFVLGIVNMRGQILSLIDIKKFFGLPEKGITELSKVIIAFNDRMELGILADAVIGVREVPLASLQPAVPTLTGIRAEYLRGVTAERLIILDIGHILNDTDIVVNVNLMQGGA